MKCFYQKKQIRPSDQRSVQCPPNPPIYLHLIFAILQFEISSLMIFIFGLFQIWILEATADRKIQFKLEKTPVHQTEFFKLENCKKQVQIDRGNVFFPQLFTIFIPLSDLRSNWDVFLNADIFISSATPILLFFNIFFSKMCFFFQLMFIFFVFIENEELILIQ